MGKEWTEKLREKMQDYQEAGPEGLWEAISEAMDNAGSAPAEYRTRSVAAADGDHASPVRAAAETVSGPEKSGRRTVRPRLKRAGYLITALSAAAAILLVAYFSFRTSPSAVHLQDNPIAAVTPGNDPQDVPAPEAPDTGTAPDTGSYTEPAHDPDASRDTDAARDTYAYADSDFSSAAGLLADNVAGQDEPAGGKDPDEAGLAEDNGTAQPAVQETTGVRDVPEHEITGGNDDMKDTGIQDSDDRWERTVDAERPKKNRRRGTIHAGLSVSNVAGASSSYAGYAGPASASVLLSRQNVEELIESSSAVVLKSSSAPATSSGNTEIRHRQPVRAGVSFRYDFTKRWGVETGLTYSLLSSSINSSDSHHSLHTEQKLHYIGIPLQISYDFLQTRSISLYANAGGMMEKCVSGRADTDYMSDGNVISESSSDIQVRPLQWSLNAALGAEVHFTPLVGFYVEPGASYFFNDGSDVSTIYKERPFNFNLEFGLRFSFR